MWAPEQDHLSSAPQDEAFASMELSSVFALSTHGSWSPVDFRCVSTVLTEHILLWWVIISINLSETEFFKSCFTDPIPVQ